MEAYNRKGLPCDKFSFMLVALIDLRTSSGTVGVIPEGTITH